MTRLDPVNGVTLVKFQILPILLQGKNSIKNNYVKESNLEEKTSQRIEIGSYVSMIKYDYEWKSELTLVLKSEYYIIILPDLIVHKGT